MRDEADLGIPVVAGAAFARTCGEHFAASQLRTPQRSLGQSTINTKELRRRSMWKLKGRELFRGAMAFPQSLAQHEL